MNGTSPICDATDSLTDAAVPSSDLYDLSCVEATKDS